MSDSTPLGRDEQADREDAVVARPEPRAGPGGLRSAGLPRRKALAMLAMAATTAACLRSTLGRHSPAGHDLPIADDDRRLPLSLRRSMPAPDPSLSPGVIAEIVRKVRFRRDMDFSELLHWLRVFSGHPPVSGAGPPVDWVLGEVTDAARLERRYGKASCLVRTPYGARYGFAPPSSRDAGPEKGFHAFQALATFAEIGVGLGQTLATPAGTTTVAALLRDLMAGFQPREVQGIEPEWAAMALLLYVPPDRSWRNRWGETVDLQAVAEMVSEASRAGAACGGIHALIALSAARQVDRAHAVLSRGTRAGVGESLGAATRKLRTSQADDGSWSSGWDGRPAGTRRAIGDAVHITGHLLEWQSLLPPEEQAPRPCLERALRFLAEVTLEASDEEVVQRYCPFSHAARVVLEASGPGGRACAARTGRARRPARRGGVLAGGPRAD